MIERLIFLDIDGVLRTWPWTCPFFTNTHGHRVASYNCRAISALNWLLRTSQAKLIISSVWREQGVRGMQEDLRDWGIHARIWSQLPRDDRRNWLSSVNDRSAQIEWWLTVFVNRGGRDDYRAVTLDDDLTLARGSALVQTTIEEGLTWDKAEMAYAYLTDEDIR